VIYTAGDAPVRFEFRAAEFLSSSGIEEPKRAPVWVSRDAAGELRDFRTWPCQKSECKHQQDKALLLVITRKNFRAPARVLVSYTKASAKPLLQGLLNATSTQFS
jgi:hypothetical protein